MTDETIEKKEGFEMATTRKERAQNPYLVPGAIVVAGIIIAVAIIFTPGLSQQRVGGGDSADDASAVLPVDEADHVLGTDSPDLYLIEYSDYQCPYCERFHNTVKDLLASYDGKVSWVYRHFPLESIHPEAEPAAEASECIAELGGNEAFWKFTDQIFVDQSALSSDRYKEIARSLSIDEAAFSQCLDSKKYTERVQRDLENGVSLGGNGTPFNVLLTKDGKFVSFAGALPKEQVKVLIDKQLRALNK